MGTQEWSYTSVYNETTNNIEKTGSVYTGCTKDWWHTLKRDTYAYDKDDNRIKVKAGKEFIPYRTDAKTYLELKDRSGKVYRFDLQESDGEHWYPYRINGIYQEDLFTDIGYSG